MLGDLAFEGIHNRQRADARCGTDGIRQARYFNDRIAGWDAVINNKVRHLKKPFSERLFGRSGFAVC
jgi:hypothetical protein